MARIKLSEDAATVVRDGVPEGRHPALIAGVDDATFNDPKVPRLTIQFTITSGLYKGISVYRSHRLRDRGDYDSLVLLARTCSLVADDGTFDTDALVGHEIILVLKRKLRSWQDRMTGKPVTRAFPVVDSVERFVADNPPGTGDAAPAAAGTPSGTEPQRPHRGTGRGAH
jgi:hypothetical protein